MPINYRAVRALSRVYAPIAAAHAAAAEADAGFDGGEFSGASHERAEMLAYYAACEHVAARFGMAGHELADQIEEASYVETLRFLDANTAAAA